VIVLVVAGRALGGADPCVRRRLRHDVGPWRDRWISTSLSSTGRSWFPRGRGEFGDEAVAFVARQVGVDAGELGFNDWSGRTIE